MVKPQKPSDDPLRYMMHARRFAMADDYIRRNGDVPTMNVIGIAAIVLSAFASELYLKCLHAIETGKAPEGHNLKNLYRNLSGPTRKKIERRWDAYVPHLEKHMQTIEAETGGTIPRDLDTLLSMGARAFVEMRYPSANYETGFFLSDLPRLLEQTIMEIKPEWKGIRHARPTPHSHRKPEQGDP